MLYTHTHTYTLHIRGKNSGGYRFLMKGHGGWKEVEYSLMAERK